MELNVDPSTRFIALSAIPIQIRVFRTMILSLTLAMAMAGNTWGVSLEDVTYVPGSTRKVSQLTGEIDQERLIPTLSRTSSRYGLMGTDLGSVFEHQGRIYFLFGDTWYGRAAAGISGNPVMIQGKFGSRGNFEVIVPGQTGGLVHFWRNNDADDLPWYGPFPSGGTDPIDAVSLVQSNYGDPGNLEVVARSGDRLLFLWRDGGGWHGPFPLIADGVPVTGVAGNPVLIQSKFGVKGNFEVVVPLRTGGMAHLWRDNDSAALPWHGPFPFATTAGTFDAISMIQNKTGTLGNLEMVARSDDRLLFLWRDGGGWHGPFPLVADGVPVTGVAGIPSLIQSTLGSNGNFEVVVPLAGTGLAHLWRDNDDSQLSWHGPVRFANRAGHFEAATLIQSNFGTPGNLEVVTRWGDHLISMWREGGAWHDGLVPIAVRRDPNPQYRGKDSDAIASVPTSSDPEAGLSLEFVQSPDGDYQSPKVPGIGQAGFEVPAAGFSANGTVYVFFTTDHSDSVKMGRCVLARATGSGLDQFQRLYDVSQDKFINLSVVEVDSANWPGLPQTSGRGLLIWGSSRYRQSDAYLAWVPLDRVEDRSAWRFYAGMEAGPQRPVWSATEADAMPLFPQGCLGEFSVTWNTFLCKWVMLYNCDRPRGIVLRAADHPWGPWSEPSLIFDPEADEGYCHFMHKSWDALNCDSVSDAMFGPTREREWGGEYGPYVISRFTRGDADSSTIYWVMSTWNPYNTVLMKTTLRLTPRSPLTGVSGNPALIQSRYGVQGNFEVLSPRVSGGLAHLWRNNDVALKPWSWPIGLISDSVENVAMIQNNHGTPGNFEAIYRSGDRLNFLWRDDSGWHGPFPLVADGQVVSGAAGVPALIQSRFGDQGNFEVVVPLASGGLAHFWRDNDAANLPWHGPVVFGTELGSVAAASLIQSNLGTPGNLEVVARSGDRLWFLWNDGTRWRGPFPIVADGVAATGVSGNPTLIQGRLGQHGNFEVVIPLATGGLAHFWRDNDSQNLLWHGPIRFGDRAGYVDAAAFIQDNANQAGNFEVVARFGTSLAHFWRQGSPTALWNGPFPIPLEVPGPNRCQDADRDGMVDRWEIVSGLDPFRDDAGLDLDHDGFANLSEFRADTLPNDARSALGLRVARSERGAVLLEFDASAGRAYVIECRDSLDTDTEWRPLQAVEPNGTDSHALIQLQPGALTTAIRFYRLVVR